MLTSNFWDVSPKQRRGPWKNTEHSNHWEGMPSISLKTGVLVYQLASLLKRRHFWVCWEHPSLSPEMRPDLGLWWLPKVLPVKGPAKYLRLCYQEDTPQLSLLYVTLNNSFKFSRSQVHHPWLFFKCRHLERFRQPWPLLLKQPSPRCQ